MAYLMLTFQINGKKTQNQTRYHFMKVVNKYFERFSRGVYSTPRPVDKEQVAQEFWQAPHKESLTWCLTELPDKLDKLTDFYSKEEINEH